MVYRKTIERTSSDLTVGRLARRDIRNPQLQACLTGPNGAVIREALCNTELNTFSLQKEKQSKGLSSQNTFTVIQRYTACICTKLYQGV